MLFHELTKWYRTIDFEQDFFGHNQTVVDHKVNGDQLPNCSGFTDESELDIVLLHNCLTGPLREIDRADNSVFPIGDDRISRPARIRCCDAQLPGVEHLVLVYYRREGKGNYSYCKRVDGHTGDTIRNLVIGLLDFFLSNDLQGLEPMILKVSCIN